MQDFKPRRPHPTNEPAEEHPILKLARHAFMLLLSGSLFVYTLISHAQNGYGFCFGAAALVMWMVAHTTQKMPLRHLIRIAVLVLLLGAIVITWLIS